MLSWDQIIRLLNEALFMKKTKKGFSFIELIVIVAICAILISLICPVFEETAVKHGVIHQELSELGVVCEYTTYINHGDEDFYIVTDADKNSYIIEMSAVDGWQVEEIKTFEGEILKPNKPIDEEAEPIISSTIISSVPVGYHFVEWATEGETYIAENHNGLQIVVSISE